MLESIAATALEKAVASAAQLLIEAKNEAAKANKYNIVCCISFLEAARTAVTGLEDEVDEILIEATMVGRYEWEKRSELYKRIQSYLNRDRLREILKEALEGVGACYKFAAQDADAFLQRKARKEQKSAAVKALLELFGSLHEYLKSLSSMLALDKGNFAGQSGINLVELLHLQNCLDDYQPGVGDAESRKQQVRELAAAAQEKRQRCGLPLAANIKRVTQELTVAFQLESAGAR